MQLIIFKNIASDSDPKILDKFINDYLCNYMYNIIEKHINYLPVSERKILDNIDKNFSIDSRKAILGAFKNIEVHDDPRSYIIKFSNTKLQAGLNYEHLINLITYGSLSVKGYSYIINFFNDIAENINEIYTIWRET